MENRINFSIPDDVINSVSSQLNYASSVLKPYLIALSADERRELPKMGDGTLPFVQKCLDYSRTNPEFAPPFIDLNGLNSDMKVYTQLLSIFRIITQLENKLSDTTMAAGVESYMASLSYYNSVKSAARIDAPGAKAIYEDLRKRFVSVGGSASPTESK